MNEGGRTRGPPLRDCFVFPIAWITLAMTGDWALKLLALGDEVGLLILFVYIPGFFVEYFFDIWQDLVIFLFDTIYT